MKRLDPDLPATTDDPRYRRSRARIARQSAAARASLYTAPVIDEAALLLVDMLTTGNRHGIADDRWDDVVALPGACLDVVAMRLTGVDHVHQAAIAQGYPQPAALAVHLVDMLHACVIQTHGIAAHRPGPYAITFNACGRLRRSVRCGADGWHYDTDGPGLISHIYAPMTEQGALAVADVVEKLAAGSIADPLIRRN